MDKSLAIIPDMSTKELGAVLARSGYFQDAKDVSQTIVKILAGRELGFGPIASMTGFYIVKGHVSISANLMAAAVKRSVRYDYRVATLSDERCTLKFYEMAGGQREELGESSFTMSDAKRAGTGNTDKFPRNMLFARAMSNGVKWFCPDVTGGPVYTPDELGVVVDNETGDIVDDAVVSPSPTRTQPAPARWSVDTAGAITTRRGSRLGGLTPEQLEILIERETGEIQSAAVYLRAYLQVRETPPTLPERMTPEEIPMGGLNADEPF